MSVCLLVMFVSLAKTAEPIEMPFEEQTRVSPTNQVLDGDPDPPSERGNFWGLSCGEKHYGTQKNHNGICATAAANCIVAGWPVSH